MSSPLRRFVQKNLEIPNLGRMGMNLHGADVLEIGSGSGYAASLLVAQRPRSYLGVDVTPAQIEIANRRGLPGVTFRLANATDLAWIDDESKDAVLIFGVLHHIPRWRTVLKECARLLRPGGRLYVEEPQGWCIKLWDAIFQWGHPEEILSLRQLRNAIPQAGFTLQHRLELVCLGVYAAVKDRPYPAIRQG